MSFNPGAAAIDGRAWIANDSPRRRVWTGRAALATEGPKANRISSDART